MDKEQIRSFLEVLGCTNIEVLAHTDWVRASCPLAPWKHQNGTDRKPSFGIKASAPGEVPMFHCFSCGTKGPIFRLLHDLTWLSGDRMAEANNMISGMEFETEHTKVEPRRRIRIDRFQAERVRKKLLRNQPVPDAVLENYPLLKEKSEDPDMDAAIAWLTNVRKVSMPIIERFALRLYVDQLLGDVGIIFPILSRSGKVMDMWVRMIDNKSFFRLDARLTNSDVDYRAPNMWFGQHAYDTDKSLFLVEGPIDAMRLATLGLFNVVASCGHPSGEQLRSIHAPSIYAAFDNDKAGRTMAKKALKALDATKRFYIDWGVVGIKDAGDLDSVAQFKKVYHAKHQIAAPAPVQEKKERRIEQKKKILRMRLDHFSGT